MPALIRQANGQAWARERRSPCPILLEFGRADLYSADLLSEWTSPGKLFLVEIATLALILARVLGPLIEQLQRGQSLSADQVGVAIRQLIEEGVCAEEKAGFLAALAQKGETIEEIAAFARELRQHSLPLPLGPDLAGGRLLDVVGTGGDCLRTFNISTTTALLASAAGITVAKHGNRAVTSSAGSADVLEALGIRTDLTPEQAADWLRDHQFAFLFAPRFHPAFRHIAPARKLCAQRGQRTVFNYLGPLLNPARPRAQLVGVPRPALCEPIARVLQTLGVQRGMVVSGLTGPVSPGDDVSGMDELSTLGDNTVAEFYQEHGFACSILAPNRFPIQPASLADFVGGDAAANALIIRRLLRREDRGPKLDAVLLNSAAALFVAGKTRTLTEGWVLAEAVIGDGRAAAKLDELVAASRACPT
jgi:anthranilate phosphoribosyltransferase